jgi:hypothetical protein
MLLGLTLLPELPVLLVLLGEILGLVGEESFLVFACLRAVALVPLTSLGEVTGELFVRGFVEINGLGATAGGTVALFKGGEYKALLRPRIALTVGSSGFACDSHGLHILGLAGCGEQPPSGPSRSMSSLLWPLIILAVSRCSISSSPNISTLALLLL